MSRGEMFDEGDMISHLWNAILICSFGDCSCQKEKKTGWKKKIFIQSVPQKCLFNPDFKDHFIILIKKYKHLIPF